MTMTRAERLKAMSTAVAAATLNPFVPRELAAGVAAMFEEIREQGERIAALERAIFEKEAGGNG